MHSLGRTLVSSAFLAASFAHPWLPKAIGQTTPFQHRWSGLVFDAFTFDGDEVWTVEDGGRIRHRSTAGGAFEFQAVPDAVKDMLRRVHFVPDGTPADGPTGWAVGDKGWIVKTTDGGANWQTLTSNLGAQVPAVLPPEYRSVFAPDTEQLYDVFFLDESRGWLAGLHGIWRTVDGGANWTTCALYMQDGTRIDGASNLPLLEEVELYAIDLVERSGGEILGMAAAEPGLVLRTTDGIVWQVVMDVRCMCVQSGGSCTLPPACESCYDCTSLPAIGGCIGAPTAPGDPQNVASEALICGDTVHFEMWDVEISRHPTEELAVAVGGQPHQFGMIFTSTDDGAHWTREPHECQAVGQPGGVDCSPAADTGFLYNNVPIGHPNHGTWTHRAKSSGSIYGVAVFSSDNTAIACGYGGGLLVRDPVNRVWNDRTSQGKLLVVPGVVSIPLTGIAASSNGGSKAVAVGYGGTIRETFDKGQSWSDPATAVHAQPWRIHDVHFTSDAVGYQVGQFARIGKTTDFGVHWSHASVDGGNPPVQGGATLFSIGFADVAHGVAVGPVPAGSATGWPAILWTADAGGTWNEPTSLTLSPGGVASMLQEVCVAGTGPSGVIYWAAGNKDFIVKSSDNGENWLQSPREPLQNIGTNWLGVAFKDRTSGIVVGSATDPEISGTQGVAYQYRTSGNPQWTDISPAIGGAIMSSLSDVVIQGTTAYAIGEKTSILGVRRGLVFVSTWSSGAGFSTFTQLAESGMPSFPLCTTNDPATDLVATPILIEAEIDASSGDLWVGGQCGRIWKRSSGGAWTEFKSQMETHIEGISIPSSAYGYFGGLRQEQPSQGIVRYHP